MLFKGIFFKYVKRNRNMGFVDYFNEFYDFRTPPRKYKINAIKHNVTKTKAARHVRMQVR